MGARNRVGTGLSYRPARLHWMGESILGVLKSLKLGLCSLTVAGIDFSVKLPLWKSLEHCFCSVPEYTCIVWLLLALMSPRNCSCWSPWRTASVQYQNIHVVWLLLALMSPRNCSCWSPWKTASVHYLNIPVVWLLLALMSPRNASCWSPWKTASVQYLNIPVVWLLLALMSPRNCVCWSPWRTAPVQ